MPIYAYRCEHCGHAKDVLQKVSDPVLTVCPACGESTFRKQVTAAGFQLKGSGWYVTDFRGDKPGGKPAEPGAGDDSKPADAKVADGKGGDSAADAVAKANGSADGGKPSKSEAPAASPAAAPAPTAAPAPSGSSSAKGQS
jgi:putative FmdB family regulatory protein